MLQAINIDLEGRGLLMRAGTIVDATLIAAPSSTKNKSGKRDSEMRSTKKGNNHYFGLKAHIGVDAQSGVVHTVRHTPANVHKHHTRGELTAWTRNGCLHRGYRGMEKRKEAQNANVNVQWHIVMTPGKKKTTKAARAQGGGTCRLAQTIDQIEKLKASIRAKVEHPFHIVKKLFEYKKLSYKGISKNAVRHAMLFAMANQVIVKKALSSQGYNHVQKPVSA